MTRTDAPATDPLDPHEVSLTVNGRGHALVVDARVTLADLLRDRLGLTGTHLGCEQGVCGACTVRLDGAPARACLTLAVQAHGHTVETVEGVAATRGPGFVDALVGAHAFQCGFCSPGIVVTTSVLADAALATGTVPGPAEVRGELAGHLCRCTGYTSIVAGVCAAIAHVAPAPDGAPDRVPADALATTRDDDAGGA